MNYIVQCTCVKIFIEIIRKDDIKLIMIYLVLAIKSVGFNVYVETFFKKRNNIKYLDAFQRTLSRIFYNFLLSSENNFKVYLQI